MSDEETLVQHCWIVPNQKLYQIHPFSLKFSAIFTYLSFSPAILVVVVFESVALIIQAILDTMPGVISDMARGTQKLHYVENRNFQ